MPHMPYLINKKLSVNGRKIFCKVTGEPGSENDGQPYIVAVTGGPGFDHEMTESYLKRVYDMAKSKNEKTPHFVVFDNLGCGQSDKAQDPEQEYTMDNFIELTAGLTEVIQKELKINKMKVCYEGGSFGSLVVMGMPPHRPEWLDPDSDIQILQITSKVGPNGAGEWDYTADFLQKNYKDHPEYEKMLAAQKKLFSGQLKDQKDYILNFVIPMGPLYLQDADKSPAIKALKGLVKIFPMLTSKTLRGINQSLKKIGLPVDGLNFFDTVLSGCSIDVLNMFFKNDFNGFNVVETVRNNIHLYQKIPINLISAKNDHMADYQIALKVYDLLPRTNSAIIFEEKHMLSRGPSKALFDKLNYDLFIKRRIDFDDVKDPAIMLHTVNDDFNLLLARAHENQNKFGTTASLMTEMPTQHRAPTPTITNNPAPPLAPVLPLNTLQMEEIVDLQEETKHTPVYRAF